MADENKKLKRLEYGYARQDWNDVTEGLALFVSTPNGRKALWWLLGECGTFENPFDSDPLVLARACGCQAIGQLLLERLEQADPDAFLAALKENKHVESARDAERRNARNVGNDGDDD